jgi:hypothetical protein
VGFTRFVDENVAENEKLFDCETEMTKKSELLGFVVKKLCHSMKNLIKFVDK